MRSGREVPQGYGSVYDAEEKIDAMIQHKKHLAEMTVSTGESWIGKLSNKELHDIFG